MGGGPREVYLGVDETQTRAIVELLGTVDGVPARCSGVLVDSSHVLSAAHCDLIVRADDGVIVVAGVPLRATVERHPTLDLLIATLASPVDDASVAPIGVLEEAIQVEWLGRLAVLAGFGRDGFGNDGALAFAALPISEFGVDDLVLDGAGESGGCDGDSGGPLLVRGARGDVRVAGVLTSSSLSCRAKSRYVRIDIARDWLMSRTAPSIGPCGTLGDVGACFDGRAIRCEGANSVVELCARVCGWVEPVGYRCIDDDPCGGVDARGACDAERAVRCERGRLSTRDCAACGACVRDPASYVVHCE